MSVTSDATSDVSDSTHSSDKSNVDDGHLPPKECTLSDGKPCRACQQQSTLRERIEETKKLLDQLVLEEREARTDINRLHDPLHHLPTEIMSHIFYFTLPKFSLQKQLSSGEYCPDKSDCETDVLTLGAVCGTWRQIAWSTPRLWTDIMLTLLVEPTMNQMDVIEEWLNRSKPFPLNIRLFLRDREQDGGESVVSQSDQCDSYPDFIDRFNEHSARWSTLSVQGYNSFIEDFIGGEDGMPLLETLQLLNIKNQKGCIKFEGPNPRPTHVHVAGYSLLQHLAISWSNVTHATLDRLSLENYVQLLVNAPQLVNLRLRHTRQHNRLIVADPPIQHRLQTFSISHRFNSGIFDSVTFSSLEDLSIQTADSPSLSGVKEFLRRSIPPLKTFCLKTKCSLQEVLEVLYELPASLIKIQLTMQQLSSEDFRNLFEHFARVPNITDPIPSQPELLPHLEIFECFLKLNDPHPIPWALLPSLLRPLSGKQRPLKKLAFYKNSSNVKGLRPIFLDNSKVNMKDSDIRGLMGLLDDGVKLFLPGKVSRKRLFALSKQQEVPTQN